MRLKIGLIALILLIPVLASAQGPAGRAFGVGLTLGEPAGITCKYHFNQKNALQAAVGFGYYPYQGGALYVDYLYNTFKLVPGGRAPFTMWLTMGIGGKIGMWYHRPHDDYIYEAGFGVRIPFGLAMNFTRAPFDIFLEIVPVVAFVHPRPFWFDFDAALGFRFYF